MTGTDAEWNTQEGREQQLVDAVIASFANTPDQRLKTVLTALVEHLHAFIREVRLTEREWQQGIDFLTRVGHITDDQRQEFILLSDVLGASIGTVKSRLAYGLRVLRSILAEVNESHPLEKKVP